LSLLPFDGRATNTNADGSLTHTDATCNTCSDWTLSSTGGCNNGPLGNALVANAQWALDDLDQCIKASSLYCMEQ
jgi:hypothetical protein